LTQPEVELAKIADLLGIQITAESINQAIKLASKSAMKHSENTHLSSYLIENPSMEFVRQAKADLGKELSPEDKLYIEDITQDIASKLGYNY
jgi:hypothetical protein